MAKIRKQAQWKSNKRLRNSIKKDNIEKASKTLALGEIGTTGLQAIKDYIDLILPYELSSFERRLKTFDKMSLNYAVATALDFNYILVEKAFAGAKAIPADPHDPDCVAYSDFVNYNIKNMQSSIRQIARDAISFKKYGFSILEKVYEKVPSNSEYYGKYKYKVKKLPFRPQTSLDYSIPFMFTDDGRDIRYLRQNIQYFENNYGYSSESLSNYYKEIPRSKFLLFGYNTTSSNPYGESPLMGCFRTVMEMDMIAEYETVGITRDMGGILVFGIPSDIINKAAADPNSKEADSIRRLEEQGALCHSGEQTSMIIPNELLGNSTNVQAYTAKLMGVDGGGKQYSTTDILKSKEKAIFDRFGCGHMILGDGGGSYALIEGKNNIHTHYVERDIDIILEALNQDLIPQLFSINSMNIPANKLPKIIAGEIQPISATDISNSIQKTGAIGLLPKNDPNFLNELYEKIGFNYRINNDLSKEEIEDMLTGDTSRSGDGLTEGMPNGTGKALGG